MSLNKKNSREIIVAGQNFRWTISPKSNQIIFVAESNEVKGQEIEVLIDSDIDRYWVEFPNVEDLNLKVITPKDAVNIISQALNYGWTPKVKRPTIRFEFKNEKLEQENYR